MTGAIGDVLDQTVRLAENIENLARHFDIRRLNLCANVIHLADLAFMEHNINRFTVVKDILVITYLQPITIDR